ncbi:dethiobiotin synthase [Solemya pervernicosa gill symbiont]|uniref:ATP-dependent dethiobiotin synthetase BioD n=2 Tax=Gammaproteobacteria incertae sedis TaxID=118884 RepID=A0A1T2LBE6_9GAMM|nr:dethiobiotin synthase [Candidatus Reidiella endopervernicosa]OOZ42322.1 dethiobiotin synthase [Solemya pervernicosa gill symbiont]QKQ25718.1 dethiobiotin synthase [Candidatus Reidiella endopervernicosa]
MSGYFVTGTDTEVGKSLVATALVHAFAENGGLIGVMKPVAAGAIETAEGLRNGDAIALQNAASISLPYELINPYLYNDSIAPHIAANQSGRTIELAQLVDAYLQVSDRADRVVVEGAGGWLLPIDDELTLADFVVALQLPVVVVVGLRLGCLNHALLTIESIQQRGLTVAGWVANSLMPQMEVEQQNIDTLVQRISAPLLGRVPFNPDHTLESVAACLDLSLLPV